MTDKDAIEIVLVAATLTWAGDTSNQTLKSALQIVDRLLEHAKAIDALWPQEVERGLAKVQIDYDKVD